MMTEIRGVLLNWGKNERGYRWVDISGFVFQAGKNGIPDSLFDSLKGQRVEAVVQAERFPTKSGKWFVRKRLLAIFPLGR